jgi:hypothetical protein
VIQTPPLCVIQTPPLCVIQTPPLCVIQTRECVIQTRECVIQTRNYLWWKHTNVWYKHNYYIYKNLYTITTKCSKTHSLLLYIHTISPYLKESLLLQNIQYRSPWQAPHFRVLGDDFRTLFIRLLLREDAVIREIGMCFDILV